MLKKILLGLLGLFILLAAVFTINTLRLGNTQLEPSGETYTADWDREAMLQRFSEAIQFQTISGDEDFETDTTEFRRFLSFIEESFPLVHSRLERRMFNELTPLYFWEGTDPGLDPILLMGHYDVVPVDSSDIDGWNYEPFSGEIADGYVWGRGTLDNKNNVMGLLETAEYLLTNEYEPRRSIYFSFGHDEEIGGGDGAAAVAQYLREQGTNLKLLLDEGGVVLEHSPLLDQPMAVIGIAEKGYLSLELIARTRGGHSSGPPNVMAVTELSKAILALHENQFPARFDGTIEHMFDSVADRLPLYIRVVYANRWVTEGLMRRLMAMSEDIAPSVRTTTAPTILRAGVKDNVLPNEARAVVNFRLLQGDTIKMVKSRVERVIDNENISVRQYGSTVMEASPISPIDGEPYLILQQVITDQFENVAVTPYLVSGATDARHFTDLTDHIFRFSPNYIGTETTGIVHGTNERIGADSYTGMIDFYSQFIRKATE